MNKFLIKLLTAVLFLVLTSSLHQFSGSITGNSTLTDQSVLYYQDFSDWSNISITGDQPNYYAQNSDPATYTAVSAVSVEAGTYLNMLDTSINLVNESYYLSYDVQVSAAASPSVRRFSRLYCHFDDESTVFTTTLELWDQVGTFSYSTTNGISKIITWDPSLWHHIGVAAVPYNNDLYMSFNYDGTYEGSLMIVDGSLLSISSCSFYVYQGKFGTGDTIKVDNFTIGINDVNVKTFNTTQTGTITNQDNVTVETTNTIDTLVTQTITTTQTAFAPANSSIMVVTLFILIPVSRKFRQS